MVKPEDRPTTPEAIDSRVAAELPQNNNASQQHLLETVQRCMLHGPCGARNPSAPCMTTSGVCKAEYPKDFVSQTTVRADGYPIYRRRDDGHAVQKAGCFMDNRDVVPYSPLLLRKYDAHINVEVVCNVRLVKYIFKYAYKGHDRAVLEVANANDEVQRHLDARYLGASEAAWRIFEFPTHGQSHAVERLAVHLPGREWVHFQEGREAVAAEAAAARNTTLTAWFHLNASQIALGGQRSDQLARALYQDIPRLCVWDRARGAWKLRARQLRAGAIGRLASVSPTEGERYFLYLLLLATPGATSFADLQTVDGVHHPTFQAAAAPWLHPFQHSPILTTYA